MSNETKRCFITSAATTILLFLLLNLFVPSFSNVLQSNTKKIETNQTTRNSIVKKTNTPTVTDKSKNLIITVIDDKRCVDCNTTSIVSQLRQAPFLKWSKFNIEDFSDKGVSDFLKAKNIKALPAVLLNKWKVDPSMDKYLSKIDDNTYSLAIGWRFNPFAKRSAKWFLLLDKAELKNIKDSSFIKWNKDAKITWLDYSDLECPFCAKLYNSSTEDDLIAKYGTNLNIIYNHFPLSFHKESKHAAEALECIASVKWKDAFYTMIKESYAKYNNNNFDLEGFYQLAADKVWTKVKDIKSCVDKKTFLDKVDKEMAKWAELFKITWTPWNVLINNETWEYAVISWAYPTASFEKVIDKLLK